MSSRGHVRFEFHPGWSTEARVTIGSHTIPIKKVRPLPGLFVVTYTEWNWTWVDGNQFQLRHPNLSDTSTKPWHEYLRVNGQTVAKGFFRGGPFVALTQQWSWQMGEKRIDTRYRIGCRPRSSLRDEEGRCLAVWIPHGYRIRGVIRGELAAPLTPLLWGMVMSTLVEV